MTAETITLASFLLARIADDEAIARFAESSGKWALAENIAVAIDNPTGYVLLDPARVLAECAAKRAIVSDFALQDPGSYEAGYAGRKSDIVFGQSIALERAVRALAAVYSDHPDYSEDWRP